MATMKSIAGVFVGIAISMLIGIIVINGLISGVDQSGWSAKANSTWSSLQNNIWVAFGLLVILPLIIGAVIIMKYVGGGGGL